MKFDPEKELTLPALAQLLGVTPRRCQQLAAAGIFKRGPGGQFPMRPNVGIYFDRLKAQAEPDQDNGVARLLNARAELIEGRVREKAKRLVDTADCVNTIRELINVVREETATLPAAAAGFGGAPLGRRVRHELDLILARVDQRFADRVAEWSEWGWKPAMPDDATSAAGGGDRG